MSWCEQDVIKMTSPIVIMMMMMTESSNGHHHRGLERLKGARTKIMDPSPLILHFKNWIQAKIQRKEAEKIPQWTDTMKKMKVYCPPL